jgi:hypothetical protein
MLICMVTPKPQSGERMQPKPQGVGKNAHKQPAPKGRKKPILDVILNSGEAGVRDRTSAEANQQPPRTWRHLYCKSA